MAKFERIAVLIWYDVMKLYEFRNSFAFIKASRYVSFRVIIQPVEKLFLHNDCHTLSK